jgi:hypothetical protein
MRSLTANAGFESAIARHAAAAACRTADARVQFGSLAGRDLEVCLVGQALMRAVHPTFAHLAGTVRSADGPASPGHAPAFVRLWEDGLAGAARPPMPGGAEWTAHGEGWRASSYDNGRYLCEERDSSLLWLDRREARLVGCFSDVRRLGCADRARPLQRLMGEFCRSLGVQEIHAASVSLRGRGVLIVGGGGRGKSTLSLDGLHGGLDFLGDDSVAIGAVEGGFQAYSLYGSARVRPHLISRWPDFEQGWELPLPPEEKAMLVPGRIATQRVVRSARIVAIVLPAVTSRGLHVEATSPLDAFHALMHESRDNRRFGLTAAEFSQVARLVKSVPCYRFEVDRDRGRGADALRSLIERQGA